MCELVRCYMSDFCTAAHVHVHKRVLLGVLRVTVMHEHR